MTVKDLLSKPDGGRESEALILLTFCLSTEHFCTRNEYLLIKVKGLWRRGTGLKKIRGVSGIAKVWFPPGGKNLTVAARHSFQVALHQLKVKCSFKDLEIWPRFPTVQGSTANVHYTSKHPTETPCVEASTRWQLTWQKTSETRSSHFVSPH